VTRKPARLGIYVDGPYGVIETPQGRRIAPDAADLPFTTFACEVGRSFDSTLLFARAQPLDEGLDGRSLLPADVLLAPLPHYESLHRVHDVARASLGTARGFWRGLGGVDAVWVFGPHPFSFVLAALAFVRRRRVVLGVRQDTMEYFRSRLPSRRWRPALLAARTLDAGYRALGRVVPATVVGHEIERRYGGPRPSLLSMIVCLVRSSDVVAEPPERDWSSTIELFTVGRIDREKNPFLLLEALAALPARYRLSWAGTGPLADAVRRRAAELGIADRITFLGFVPFGGPILQHYRDAHLFVHVSLTEGVPAVLMEALASGTPVVATDVGGVREALEDGACGILVPPDDRDALVAAIERAAADPALRARMSARGLRLARERTLDAQAARTARFVKGAA
jgi:glycosyltransferase involved in cell wall biosynthesis